MKFVCFRCFRVKFLHLVFGAMLFPAVTFSTQCLVGEIYVPQTMGSPALCLWLELTDATAVESHNKCLVGKGELARITNSDIQNALAGYLYHYQTSHVQFFIGINDMEDNGKYVSFSGDTQAYFQWGSNHNPSPTFGCIVADPKLNSAWVEADCVTEYKAVCSRPVDIKGNSKTYQQLFKNRMLTAPDVGHFKNVYSVHYCAALCGQAVGCLSFNYAHESNHCLLKSGKTQSHSMMTKAGYDYYEMMSSVYN